MTADLDVSYDGMMQVMRRRLAQGSSPAWSDILAIICVCALLLLSLRFVVFVSSLWQRTLSNRLKEAVRNRRAKDSVFRTENGYSWDFVFVFKVYDEDDILSDNQRIFNMKRILAQLGEGGLETRLSYSVQHDEVYCKVRAPMTRLLQQADKMDMKLLIDSKALRNMCLNDATKPWTPLSVLDVNPDTSLSPYDYIYCKYEYDGEKKGTIARLDGLFKNYASAVLESHTDVENPSQRRSIFRGVDRLKIINDIVTSYDDGCCGIDTYFLLNEGCIMGYFPLHDYVELRSLERNWLVLLQFPWNQCVDDVKDYFGEKIGLYFQFLGHYTTWLFPAAVFGLVSWFIVASKDNDPNTVFLPYFGITMAIWTTFVLEFWKRKEKFTAMRWGMIGFEENEPVRPQFLGDKGRSPVTGRPALNFPRSERFLRIMQSNALIAGLCVVVIAVIAIIFAIRMSMQASRSFVAGSVQLGGIVASIINALQIQLFNYLFGYYAVRLNDFENYRTDTEYEDALIAKVFVFQFVNSYTSLFYIAFLKPYIQDIDPCLYSCMAELQVSLGTIFIVQMIIGNIFEVGIPSIVVFNKIRAESKNVPLVATTKGKKIPMSDVEVNYCMDTYDYLLGTVNDYSELVLQFGYVTMFVTAFPLATTMAFVNNYVEIRVDAWKLCQLMRRPEPRSVEDIGTWYIVLEIIAILSVFVNSGIIAFTSDIAINLTYPERVWLFILLSAFVLAIRWFVGFLVPDEPAEVAIQAKRQKYLTDKVLYDIMDEDDSEFSKNNQLVPNYIINKQDEDPI